MSIGYHSAINKGYDSPISENDSIAALYVNSITLDKSTCYIYETPLAAGSWGGGVLPYQDVSFYDWNGNILYTQSATYENSFIDIPIGQNSPPLGSNHATLVITDGNGITVTQYAFFNVIDGRPNAQVSIDNFGGFDAVAEIINIVPGANGGGYYDIVVDWGDSVFEEDASASASGTSFSHTYLESGSYNVVVTILDTANGQSNSYNATLVTP